MYWIVEVVIIDELIKEIKNQMFPRCHQVGIVHETGSWSVNLVGEISASKSFNLGKVSSRSEPKGCYRTLDSNRFSFGFLYELINLVVPSFSLFHKSDRILEGDQQLVKCF